MYVCFVRHPDSDREFIFDCLCDVPFSAIRPGAKVLCETMRGDVIGTVTSDLICLDSQSETLTRILERFGAYLPLKKIRRLVYEPTEAERRAIAIKWLQEHFSSLELPF